ncbi:MAG TPA: UDP-N-acetylglucosamine--N-acetylmuramyl-(pentapeptide) pyrophosphoryl-undecaprenol N-acetylglucosamine transferase, partial [Verrucomicrobiae bacterium]|nr:UDP-N-acetylglucosamine--N-acetylmuramyl-(pentapeptide) pyrophosphoryl-undecaprenol N-acetylglucosamine transferase [Verrucomicrobiae bacterium]
MAGALTSPTETQPIVAIACGGTGGHLFPGLAVGLRLRSYGCRVVLLISSKEVDRQAVQGVKGMEIVTLPAVGLVRGGMLAFARGFLRSYRVSKDAFRRHFPQAALAMGGFTSAAPIVAAKRLGSRTFLHESNSIPGRANRWLSRVVDQAFVGFPAAAARLHTRRVLATGTPVRPQFQPREGAACRQALGLAPERPAVCVLGGSQGASGINQLIVKSLPKLRSTFPHWQWIHLTGVSEFETVKSAYAAASVDAVVFPFLSEMELALGAASAAVSRAGASSLSELAAMRVPAVLIPYPAAADDHQSFNARAFCDSGAARMLPQGGATTETLVETLQPLVE